MGIQTRVQASPEVTSLHPAGPEIPAHYQLGSSSSTPTLDAITRLTHEAGPL
jgi:hypothetical protein